MSDKKNTRLGVTVELQKNQLELLTSECIEELKLLAQKNNLDFLIKKEEKVSILYLGSKTKNESYWSVEMIDLGGNGFSRETFSFVKEFKPEASILEKKKTNKNIKNFLNSLKGKNSWLAYLYWSELDVFFVRHVK